MRAPFTETVKDIRWLGEQDQASVWEIECQQHGTIDPEQLLVRLHDATEPMARVAKHPLRFTTPAGIRGGRFVAQYQGKQYPLVSRQIPLNGSPNCRDLGGYLGAEQKRVAWRKLLRSGHWYELSADDLRYVEQLGIVLICDFRSEEEQSRQPTKLPQNTDIQCESLAITPGSAGSFFERFNKQLGEGSIDAAHALMCDINRELVTHHKAQYQRMFELILNQKRGAVMINCTAGKDRTGFGAALILLALGVSEDTVVQDYLKTIEFTKNRIKNILSRYTSQHNINEAVIAPMLSVRHDYIESALNTIHKEYGTADNYLRELGMDAKACAELRHMFLV